MNRRQFLAITAGITAGAALAGCRTESLFDPFPGLSHWPTQTTDASWRLLNRVTCGPRPAERRRLAHIGPAAFIEEQLAPESLPEIALRPRLRLRRLETLHLAAPELFNVAEAVATGELQQAALLRAVYSPRQLLEVMVNFWSDRFNIAQTN